jgi:hypothetical protein
MVFDTFPMGFVNELLADLREIILTIGILHVR